MLRRIAVLSLVVGAFTMVAQAAFADNPHFQKASASTSGTNLVVSFREVGLGNTASDADITAGADATATYGCINKGDHHPSAENKETTSAPVSNTGSFPIRNGAASGSITVSPPPAPSNFSCPDDMTLALLSVSYTNVYVSGAGATQPIPGTYTAP